ncbi:MAG: hypothetical protein RLZZ31_1506, partial [Actinomycetota bacterium]
MPCVKNAVAKKRFVMTLTVDIAPSGVDYKVADLS